MPDSNVPHSNGTWKVIKSNVIGFLIGALISYAVAYGQYGQKFVQADKDIAELKVTAKRMDDWGTVYGHYGEDAIKLKESEIDLRLVEVEKQTRQMDVMNAAIVRLDLAVSKLEARK
jgi:hypothetical protein